MLDLALKPYPWMAGAGRLPTVGDARGSITVAEWIALGGCGILAGVSSVVLDFQLRLPGHAILRVVLPLMLGLSLVPRRGGGSLMSAAGALTALTFAALGWTGRSPGAMTSLLLIGPALDVALRWSQSAGWRLYVWFAAAALTANAAAFAVRLGSAALLEFGPHGRNIVNHWPLAVVSYAVFGAAAGLISAAICFRLRVEDTHDHRSPEKDEKGEIEAAHNVR